MLSGLATVLLWAEHRLLYSGRCSFRFFYGNALRRLKPLVERGAIELLPANGKSATYSYSRERYERRDLRARW